MEQYLFFSQSHQAARQADAEEGVGGWQTHKPQLPRSEPDHQHGSGLSEVPHVCLGPKIKRK